MRTVIFDSERIPMVCTHEGAFILQSEAKLTACVHDAYGIADTFI